MWTLLVILVVISVVVYWIRVLMNPRQVAERWFACEYCLGRVRPGDWIVEGPKGWGHRGCVL